MLRAAAPLIDLRAPGEFARGTIPGAVNLPLLDDAERHQVGATYADRGSEAALALGHRLVSGATRAARLDAWQRFASTHPGTVLFCWRGGQRSSIVQRWLAERGCHVPRIAGGFKALRRFLLESIEDAGARYSGGGLMLVGGRTGTGKTHLLKSFTRHLDLEGCANHRGSTFGRRATPQPAPIDFEHRIALALLRLGGGPLLVEDESRTIGRLGLPEALYRAMQGAPLVVVTASREQRIDAIVRDYIEDGLAEFNAEYAGDGFEAFAAGLISALDRIERRLGGQRHHELRRILKDCLDRQRRGAAAQVHRAWIGPLLDAYYDPMYDYQIAAKAARIRFRGSFAACREWLAEWFAG